MNVFLDDLCPEKTSPTQCPSLASLLSLLDRIPALVWTTDAEARFNSLTGAGLQAAGASARDYAGQPVGSLFGSLEGNPRARLAHQRALRGQSCSFDAEIGGRDLQVHLEPLRGRDGATVGVIGAALDLTDRMVAEKALRLSELSYRSLIEQAPYGICRTTVSGQLLQVNRAMLEMLGYDANSEAELLIRDLPLIFDTIENYLSFRNTLQAEGTVQGVDRTWRRRDAFEIQVRMSGRAVRDPAGEVLYLDVLAEDVTEKKQLEAQLSQAQKMQAVGQLAGGVAHDFNNLLTVIGGQVELMLGRTVDPDLRQRLVVVKQASERAAWLTRQLLAFSRRQVLQSKLLNLNQVIGHLIGMLSRLIKENVELTFLPGADLGSVRADPNQVEQVLMNLAVNAQDAMPQGGRLTIETANIRIVPLPHHLPEELEPGDYVRITVRDTGHGMDQATLARIFEPFFTTKKAGEGTGLGLSMIYGVVKQSGGHIRVESKPREGTTFMIYLPLVDQAEPAGKRPAPADPLAGGCETILLAEDEDSVRTLVSAYLTELGYRVLPAPNGADALEIARSCFGTVDLLLSDFVMPKLGGRELASELRRADPNLKVIFMSGYAGHAVAAKDLELPDAYFLPKPLSLSLLAKTVREALDRVAGGVSS